jgi:prevent-host-death family protein
MSKVTSTEANRQFSKLLADAVAGRSTDITVHGKLVARLVPVSETEAAREDMFRKHLEDIRKRPAMNLPRVTRDEMYDDD